MSLLAFTIVAAEIAFRSVAPVAVVELFTSEGCSSCPPADEWMTQLADEPGIWKEFVPVSFHVDYWDSIGWKDRFASPAFTQRQYDYGSAWKTTSVFTSSIVRDGERWTAWRKAKHIDKRGGNVPELTLVVDRAQRTFRIESAATKACRRAVFVPLLLKARSKVVRGENAARTLDHAFVALELHEAKLDAKTGKASGRYDAKRADAVAAWSTSCSDPTPLPRQPAFRLGAARSA